MKKVDTLYEHGIHMNGQIVLCKGINDGEELERTIRDLTRYLPVLESVSVVPVGLTRFREGLYPLEPFDKEDARKVLEIIHRWQEKICPGAGTAISSMPVMSGIFWQGRNCRRKSGTTGIFSWRTAWGCCGF